MIDKIQVKPFDIIKWLEQNKGGQWREVSSSVWADGKGRRVIKYGGFSEDEGCLRLDASPVEYFLYGGPKTERIYPNSN